MSVCVVGMAVWWKLTDVIYPATRMRVSGWVQSDPPTQREGRQWTHDMTLVQSRHVHGYSVECAASPCPGEGMHGGGAVKVYGRVTPWWGTWLTPYQEQPDVQTNRCPSAMKVSRVPCSHGPP